MLVLMRQCDLVQLVGSLEDEGGRSQGRVPETRTSYYQKHKGGDGSEHWTTLITFRLVQCGIDG